MERNRKTLLDTIACNNDCSVKDAEDLLQDELNVCRDRLSEGDLQYSDLEDLCMSVGCDFDEIEQLILMI